MSEREQARQELMEACVAFVEADLASDILHEDASRNQRNMAKYSSAAVRFNSAKARYRTVLQSECK